MLDTQSGRMANGGWSMTIGHNKCICSTPLSIRHILHVGRHQNMFDDFDDFIFNEDGKLRPSYAMHLVT